MEIIRKPISIFQLTNGCRYSTKTVAPHTNLTEIDLSLQLLWRNGISPGQVVMGLGFYGRSFTLANPSCNTPGCPFSGGGNPGSCTATSGILSFSEIQRIITQYDITPTLDSVAAIKYMSWNNNQWVSYDDADTFALKLAYANTNCLAGTSMSNFTPHKLMSHSGLGYRS
jgi:chitinase